MSKLRTATNNSSITLAEKQQNGSDLIFIHHRVNFSPLIEITMGKIRPWQSLDNFLHLYDNPQTIHTTQPSPIFFEVKC